MKFFKRFRRADAVVTAALLLLCAVLFAVSRQGNGAVAVVTENGTAVREIDLAAVGEPYTIALDGGVVISVAPGRIAFAESGCRGQDCVRRGALTKPGQSAACLPNRVLIRITGKTDRTAPDAISF